MEKMSYPHIQITHGDSPLSFLRKTHPQASKIVDFADKELENFKRKIQDGFIYENFLGWTIQEKNGLWYAAIRRNNQFFWGKVSASNIENAHPGWTKRQMFRWLLIEARNQKQLEIFGNW